MGSGRGWVVGQVRDGMRLLGATPGVRGGTLRRVASDVRTRTVGTRSTAPFISDRSIMAHMIFQTAP